MKILFIASTYKGGTGAHAQRVADKLREHGFDVKLMHVPHIPIKKLKNLSFVFFGIIKAIFLTEKFDVVHAFNVPSAFVMKYCKAEKKILSLYGVYSEQIGMMYSKTAGSVSKSVEIKALKYADKLSTDSKAVQKQYKEKLGVEFECLYTPLDPEKFKDIPDVEKKDRQVVYVGRNSYEKGIDILKKIESRINADVIYCTDMSWRDAMIKLKESQLMVVPSRAESSPHVIKEAFYLKVPIVATTVGGIPELISNNKNGILVEPDDSEELLNAINGALNDKNLQRLAQNGYEFVTKNFTWESLLPEYMKFYEDLVKST